MLRLLCRGIGCRAITAVKNNVINNIQRVLPNTNSSANFTTLVKSPFNFYENVCSTSDKSILLNPKINEIVSQDVPSRTLTKFSYKKGKRKTVKTVLKRFYRLNWGIWIRTKAGRHKKMYLRSRDNKRRTRQHVFCSGTQSWLLDSMVTRFWRKPMYFVDDPYEPYHTREEFPFTRRKPKPNL